LQSWRTQVQASTENCEQLDDDPDGSNPVEPSWTRIWISNPQSRMWDRVAWQLAPRPENATWVGLSEITRVDGGWISLSVRRHTVPLTHSNPSATSASSNCRHAFPDNAHSRGTAAAAPRDGPDVTPSARA
jgi:hypothetical protein